MSKSNKVNKLKHLFLGVIAFLLLFLDFISATPTTIESVSAQSIDNVRLYFKPQSSSIGQNTLLDFMIDAGPDRIAFVDVEIAYDPTKIVLINEVQLNSQFTSIFRLTKKDEANLTGKIIITAGLSLNLRDTPPVGEFSFAQLTFRSRIGVSQNTSVLFNEQEIQVVDINSAELPFTSESVIIRPSVLGKINPSDKAVGISRQVVLSWSSVSGGNQYQYCITTKPQEVVKNQCKKKDKGWVRAGTRTNVLLLLKGGKRYYWQVRALMQDGTYVYANSRDWWEFTTAKKKNNR